MNEARSRIALRLVMLQALRMALPPSTRLWLCCTSNSWRPVGTASTNQEEPVFEPKAETQISR